MSKQRLALLAVLGAALIPAFAPAVAAAADSSLRGQFTFNWHMDPNKTKCARIDDKLLATLTSPQFRCDPKPHSNTASGKPALTCTRKDEGAEYLIFGTLAACEDERKTQVSNGD